jgi:hypothetical protein
MNTDWLQWVIFPLLGINLFESDVKALLGIVIGIVISPEIGEVLLYRRAASTQEQCSAQYQKCISAMVSS